jgi:L-threonylcarbamoyladenylate synthase
MSPQLLRFDDAAIVRAVDIVEKGGLIVYPTDTVYGLGCDPLDQRAVEKLFKAKGRGSKPVPVLCASLEDSLRLVTLSPKALELAASHWPGALTIVAPLRRRVPSLLHQGTRTLGVRIPASQLCVELIKGCGGLLTGTSANRSGRPSARTAEEARRDLGSSVDLIMDGGRLRGNESTVVKVVGRHVTVLRQGKIGVSA